MVKGEICLLSPLTLDLFPQNHRRIIQNSGAITRNIDFGELCLGVLVIGVVKVGRYVRLSFAYVQLKAEMPMVSSIDK